MSENTGQLIEVVTMNSAGGLGAIAIVYIIGFLIALVITIGIIWGAVKFFQ